MTRFVEPAALEGSQPALFAVVVLGYGVLVAGYRLYQRRRGGLAPEDLFGSYRQWARVSLVWGAILVLLTLVWANVADLPAAALGLDGWTVSDVRVGLGLGLALAGVSLLLEVAFDRLGVPESELRVSHLRTASPDSRGGWVLHVFGVLPVVVLGTELFYRGALVGGPAAAWDLPAVVLIAISAGCQGGFLLWQGLRAVTVTLVRAGGLAAALVVSGSLLVPVTAVLVGEFVARLLSRLETFGTPTAPSR